MGGELIRYSLFGFIHHDNNFTNFAEIFRKLSGNRNTDPCVGGGTSPKSNTKLADCVHPESNFQQNGTRRWFHIHVFLYRRVDSAALLLHDLTNAEYKVDARVRFSHPDLHVF